MARHAHNGVEIFQNLRRLFEKAQIRYPGFSDEFSRTTREHLSKGNSSSSNKNNSTTDDNNSQLISGVVKLRI